LYEIWSITRVSGESNRTVSPPSFSAMRVRDQKNFKFTRSQGDPRELVWGRSCVGNVIQPPTSQVDSEGAEVEQFDEFVLRVNPASSLPIIMRANQHLVDYEFPGDPGRHGRGE